MVTFASIAGIGRQLPGGRSMSKGWPHREHAALVAKLRFVVLSKVQFLAASMLLRCAQ